MAIYHFEQKILKRNRVPNIVAASAYRSGERIHDEKTGEIHDYSKRYGVLYSRIMCPSYAPEWVSNRAKLWNTVNAIEKRRDAQLAREIIVALPCELNLEQQIELVSRFSEQQFTKIGIIVDFAIHASSKKGDDRNMHAHILKSMRSITSDGFGKKAREWNARHFIFKWRQAWESHVNMALERAGLDCRVDCRSHAAKGLDREPRLHLGYKDMAIERMGGQSVRGNENRAIDARNEQRAQSRSEQIKSGDEGEDIHSANQQQPTSQIDNTQCLDANNSGIDQDKVQQAELALINSQALSMNERKDALEQYSKLFEEWRSELNCQINSTPDTKTQDRLRLQEKLQYTYFTEVYNKQRASLLDKEGRKKYASEISACEHRERKARKEYQKCVAEWHLRAVRDCDYIPTDPKLADIVNKIKDAEVKRWSEFASKVKKNCWDASRIEIEKLNLKKRLDSELKLSFGLESNLGMGR